MNVSQAARSSVLLLGKPLYPVETTGLLQSTDKYLTISVTVLEEGYSRSALCVLNYIFTCLLLCMLYLVMIRSQTNNSSNERH